MKAKEQNYTPGSMSFASGFLGPQGDVGYFMNADFEKAKKIILLLLEKGKEIEDVEMGLDGDWSCNSMVIWENGIFEEYDCHDSSQWAEPIIIVNYKDGSNESFPVWFREIETEATTEADQKLLN